MKNMAMEVGKEVIQNPKTQQVIIGAGGATGIGTFMEVLPTYVGLAASIVAILVSISIFYFNHRRDKRETVEHDEKMRKLRTRRSSDPSGKSTKEK